jgi:2-haloacid dehalogenase
MAIITNGISKVQRSRLAISPIESFFDGLFISEEIGYSKPAAGYFDAVMDALYHPQKESVLVIGDSLSSDMRGGINYGLDTCWFNPQENPNTLNLPVTYQIQDLRQLSKLLTEQ